MAPVRVFLDSIVPHASGIASRKRRKTSSIETAQLESDSLFPLLSPHCLTLDFRNLLRLVNSNETRLSRLGDFHGLMLIPRRYLSSCSLARACEIIKKKETRGRSAISIVLDYARDFVRDFVAYNTQRICTLQMRSDDFLVADNSSRIPGGSGGRLGAEFQAFLHRIWSLRPDRSDEGSKIKQR